jgi:hypothetical protein
MTSPENPFIVAPGSALARLGRLSVRAVSPAALYDDWLVAETEATLALVAWRAAERSEKAAAYARYVAHTDAEEDAAVRLCERLAAAGDWPVKTGQ